MTSLVPVVYLPHAKADVHQKLTGNDQQFSEENTGLKCEFNQEVNVDSVGFLLFALNSHCQLSRSQRGRNE